MRIPSPNIWHWPEVYAQENAAQDVEGAVWAALRDAAPWTGRDVVDIGCGDGYHLRFFDGARSVLGVEPYAPLVERAQAGNAAYAAKEAGVRHVVWSTLEDTRTDLPLDDPRVPLLDGTYTVPHFDAKAEADQIFRDLGVPTTFLRTTFFWEAFLQGFAPHRDGNGRLVLTLPTADSPLAGIAAADIGRVALGIFTRGVELVGTHHPVHQTER